MLLCLREAVFHAARLWVAVPETHHTAHRPRRARVGIKRHETYPVQKTTLRSSMNTPQSLKFLLGFVRENVLTRTEARRQVLKQHTTNLYMPSTSYFSWIMMGLRMTPSRFWISAMLYHNCGLLNNTNLKCSH